MSVEPGKRGRVAYIMRQTSSCPKNLHLCWPLAIRSCVPQRADRRDRESIVGQTEGDEWTKEAETREIKR